LSFSSNEAKDNTFECKLDSAGWEACGSPRNYTQLAVGAHHFEVRAKVLGAEDPSPATRDWTVKPPETEITTFARPGPSSNEGTLYFRSPNDPEATFQCKFDSQNWAACTNGRHYTLIDFGEHTIQVKAIDLGSEDPTPAIWKFTRTH
jgi:hypothetical protein